MQERQNWMISSKKLKMDLTKVEQLKNGNQLYEFPIAPDEGFIEKLEAKGIEVVFNTKDFKENTANKVYYDPKMFFCYAAKHVLDKLGASVEAQLSVNKSEAPQMMVTHIKLQDVWNPL